MLGLIAAALIILCLFGLLAFHVSIGLMHIVFVVGIIMLHLHYFRERSSQVLRIWSVRRSALHL
jgi:hypothetical protein